jgi:methionine-rich copper-binding protein CopC
MSLRIQRAGSLLGLAAAAALIALLMPGTAAQARTAHPTVPFHAAYKSSIPAANSIVKTDPTQVTITFLQNLSPQGLKIMVYDNKGQVVSTDDAQIVTGQPATAIVHMKGDGSDIYRVDWQNVSAQDGDSTLGAFVFGVGDTDKVVPPTTTTTSSGVAVPFAILIGIVGLVLGYVGATFFRPRTSTTK